MYSQWGDSSMHSNGAIWFLKGLKNLTLFYVGSADIQTVQIQIDSVSVEFKLQGGQLRKKMLIRGTIVIKRVRSTV